MDPLFKLIVDDREVASGVLHRAIAPAAVAELERLRRLTGNVLLRDNAIGIVTRLKIGPSKARTQFRAGEMAVNPADGSLWIFVGDSQSHMPMVPLGNIAQGLEELAGIRRGARLTLIVRTE